MQTFFIVRYTGPFGFIKPWTAVRDELTYSQTFLTPSIIEGMRQKLEVSTILRHRLQHRGLSIQQERTQTAGWTQKGAFFSRSLSILKRGVMLQPQLTLAFATQEEAERAATQHLCLCRNEDVILPFAVEQMRLDEFEALPGIELLFSDAPNAFLVGFNRFADAAPMYGHLTIVGANDAQGETP